MDFFILLGFKVLFDFLCPEQKTPTKQSAPNVEAAFWYGTSYENLNKESNYNPKNIPTENSEYENIW